MNAEMLQQIFDLCIVPLLGVLTAFLVAYIKRKTEEITVKEDNELKTKYINLLSDTIQEAVISTSQTYVDSLKKQGKFDAVAQEAAFRQTYEKVMAILTEDAREVLTEIYSDLDAYITVKIESEVRANKIEVAE